MEENNNTVPNSQKAVSMESLAALSEIIPTKEEVDEKINAAVSTCASIAFATTEEVLALFQKKPAGTPETPEEEA